MDDQFNSTAQMDQNAGKYWQGEKKTLDKAI